MSSPCKKRKTEDSLSQALTDLPALLAQREQELHDQQAALSNDRQALAEEMALFGSAAQGEVLQLNVGGTLLQVTRRVLTSVEGSLLAAQFSGRWDDNLARDAAGNLFVDQSALSFQRLVDILRDRMNAIPGAPAVRPPDVVDTFRNDRSAYEAFVRLVHYYGCTHAIWPCELRCKAQSSGRQKNDSSSTTTTTLADSASFPAFYYPNLQVSPSESTPTKLRTKIVPHHHQRYPNAVEIILMNPATSTNTRGMFGWSFRTTAIHQQDSTVVSGNSALLVSQHCVAIDTATGLLRLDGQAVEHINNGVPFLPILSDEQQQDNNNHEDKQPCTVVRMELKRSIFYFYWNGRLIATCTVFKTPSIQRPMPFVVVREGPWRISDLVLEA